MTDSGTIDEPAPTIVGPQPSQSGSGRKLNIPRGLELLVTLAGLNSEWHGKVLADPVGAAAQAGIALTESERAILKSLPPATLAGMTASFARKHGGASFGRLAAGAAAAALLAGTAYAGEIPAAPGGVRSDEPAPKRPVGMETEGGIRPDIPEEAPPVLWMNSLEAALAQAQKTRRALMVVFPHPNPDKDDAPALPNAGISATAAGVSIEQRSQKVVLTGSKEFRAAVRNANLIAARVAQPVRPPDKPWDKLTDEEKKAAEAYEKASTAYAATLKKYGLEEKKLPAVVFAAPDGSELSKLVQPEEEAKFVEAIKAVPPLLATWVAAQRKERPRPGPVGGARADVPEKR